MLDNSTANQNIWQILILCEPDASQGEIKNLLSLGGYRLIFTHRLTDAFAVLGQEPIHLIVSGVHLEQSDSCEFLNRVKASPSWRKIPFVFLYLERTRMARYVDHALELAANALGASKYFSVDIHSQAEIQAEIASCL